MMAIRDNPSFFRALRRERGLFTLVGTVLLLFNLFQPLALAGPMQAGGWSICYGLAADAGADQTPDTPRPNCPTCVSGICASMSVSAKALVSFALAFTTPLADSVSVRKVESRRFFRTRAGPPPAIRAPPFTA
jgi:hypothetical protein